ncbi:MAG TPA: CsiV family protein [Gammaproteobacteria bacterium]
MNAQRYRRPLWIASALLGVSFATAALGQAPTTSTESAGPPLYRVEIIVFARPQGNAGEEDFAYIARREALNDGPAPGAIDVFDFGPYVPDEILPGDPDADRDPRSRLLLGQDAEPGRERNAGAARADSNDSADQAPSAATDADAAGPAAPGIAGTTTPDAAGPDASVTAEGDTGEADAVVDPFGGPGNAAAPFRFRLLTDSELELVDVRRRLARSYTPLVHGGWIQEGLPAEQARPFDLAYLGADTPSGTIRLHVSRFLHLTLDLDFRPAAARPAAAEGDDARTGNDALGAERPTPFGARTTLSEVGVSRTYHLNAERRMRSGEIHYFDHPFFGVIAVVRPYEPPTPPDSQGVRPAA